MPLPAAPSRLLLFTTILIALLGLSHPFQLRPGLQLGPQKSLGRCRTFSGADSICLTHSRGERGADNTRGGSNGDSGLRKYVTVKNVAIGSAAVLAVPLVGESDPVLVDVDFRSGERRAKRPVLVDVEQQCKAKLRSAT